MTEAPRRRLRGVFVILGCASLAAWFGRLRTRDPVARPRRFPDRAVDRAAQACHVSRRTPLARSGGGGRDPARRAAAGGSSYGLARRGPQSARDRGCVRREVTITLRGVTHTLAAYLVDNELIRGMTERIITPFVDLVRAQKP